MRTGSEVIKMTKRQKELFFLRLGVSGKISAATIIVLAVIAGLSYFAYIQWIEPRLEAAKFEDSLAEFGARKFHIPHNYSEVPEGEVPYRIGKVLAVIPEHKIYMNRKGEIVPPKIHPIWYKLDGETRASEPDEVNTLIRISRDLKGARRYQRIDGVESKIVSAHILHIDVYDWENQTYIGRWTLDPGKFTGEVMQEEDLDEMIKATSDDTVLEFIESMPEA
jgi:hypothetical protein